MFKIIILFLLLFSSFFIFKDNILSFIKKDYEIIEINNSNNNYKTKPNDPKGAKFEGESLEIYEVTRERLLPQVASENKDHENNNKIINKENFYIQIAAYKNYESAENQINIYKNSDIKDINDLKYFISQVDIEDKGICYRLRVGPLNDINKVYELCNAFKIDKLDCVILKGLKN